MKLRTKIIFSGIALILTAVALYVGNYFYERGDRLSPPHPIALEAMESSPDVRVLRNDWFVFMPKRVNPSRGFIFYPGGLVDPKAYAPFAQDIAVAGYLVVIPPMPLNFAFFNPYILPK